MPYKVSHRSRFEKDIKKFKKNKLAQELVKQNLEMIVENPDLGEPMKGNLFPFMKISFGESPEYRMLYIKYECCSTDENCRFEDLDNIEECEGMIEFIFVRTRENCNNLYRQSKKYFEDFLRE